LAQHDVGRLVGSMALQLFVALGVDGIDDGPDALGFGRVA